MKDSMTFKIDDFLYILLEDKIDSTVNQLFFTYFYRSCSMIRKHSSYTFRFRCCLIVASEGGGGASYILWTGGDGAALTL